MFSIQAHVQKMQLNDTKKGFFSTTHHSACSKYITRVIYFVLHFYFVKFFYCYGRKPTIYNHSASDLSGVQVFMKWRQTWRRPCWIRIQSHYSTTLQMDSAVNSIKRLSSNKCHTLIRGNSKTANQKPKLNNLIKLRVDRHFQEMDLLFLITHFITGMMFPEHHVFSSV